MKKLLISMLLLKVFSLLGQNYQPIDVKSSPILFPYTITQQSDSGHGALIWSASTPDITFLQDDCVAWGLEEGIPILINRPEKPGISRAIWEFKFWPQTQQFHQTLVQFDTVGQRYTTALVYDNRLGLVDQVPISDPHVFTIVDTSLYLATGSIRDSNALLPYIELIEPITHNIVGYWDPNDLDFGLDMWQFPQSTCTLQPTATTNDGYVDLSHQNSIAFLRSGDTLHIGILCRNQNLIIYLKFHKVGGVWKVVSVKTYADGAINFSVPHDLRFLSISANSIVFSLFDNGSCKLIPETGLFAGELTDSVGSLMKMKPLARRLYDTLSRSSAMGSAKWIDGFDGPIIGNTGAWYPFNDTISQFGMWASDGTPIFTVKNDSWYSLYSIDYVPQRALDSLPRPTIQWQPYGDSLKITVLPADSNHTFIMWADGYNGGWERVIDSSELYGIKTLAYVSADVEGFWFATRRLPLPNTYSDISTVGMQNIVNVYPNPVSDIVYVSNVSSEDVSIYDRNGRQIAVKGQYRGRNAAIDVSTFPAGVYFVRIVSMNGNSVKRVVVQH